MMFALKDKHLQIPTGPIKSRGIFAETGKNEEDRKETAFCSKGLKKNDLPLTGNGNFFR
jgi:hypothetical protein